MSNKVKGARSVFNKNLNDIHSFKAGFNKDAKYICKGLIIDIISGNKTMSNFLPGEKFEVGGIYFICGIDVLKRVLPVQLRGITYDQLRQEYGSDWNIIGRLVNIETIGYDEYSIRKGKVSFLPPYNGVYYENEDANVPVSFGGSLGYSSRLEDREFHLKEPSNYAGEIWRTLI